MTGPEFLSYTEERHTLETVQMLKLAALGMYPDVVWTSSDDEYMYSAEPIGEPVEEDADLATMPLDVYREIMNDWHLFRVSNADVKGQVIIDTYIIPAGQPMRVVHHELGIEALLDKSPHPFEFTMTAQLEIQTMLGMGEPDISDYATVDNALFDLAAHQNAQNA